VLAAEEIEGIVATPGGPTNGEPRAASAAQPKRGLVLGTIFHHEDREKQSPVTHETLVKNHDAPVYSTSTRA